MSPVVVAYRSIVAAALGARVAQRPGLPRPVLGRLVVPGEPARPRALPRLLRRPRPRRLGDAGAGAAAGRARASAIRGCWPWPIRRPCSPCRPPSITSPWRGCAAIPCCWRRCIADHRRGLSADLVLHRRRIQRGLRRSHRRHGGRRSRPAAPAAATLRCCWPLGLLCLRSYEAMIYLGPLIAAAILWSAPRGGRDPVGRKPCAAGGARLHRRGRWYRSSTIVDYWDHPHFMKVRSTSVDFWQNMQFAIPLVGLSDLRASSGVRRPAWLQGRGPIVVIGSDRACCWPCRRGGALVHAAVDPLSALPLCRAAGGRHAARGAARRHVAAGGLAQPARQSLSSCAGPMSRGAWC